MTRGWCPSAGTTLPSPSLPLELTSVNLHDPSTTPVSPATKQFWPSALQVVLGHDASSILGSAMTDGDQADEGSGESEERREGSEEER